jgi:hypothetical protein
MEPVGIANKGYYERGQTENVGKRDGCGLFVQLNCPGIYYTTNLNLLYF